MHYLKADNATTPQYYFDFAPDSANEKNPTKPVMRVVARTAPNKLGNRAEIHLGNAGFKNAYCGAHKQFYEKECRNKGVFHRPLTAQIWTGMNLPIKKIELEVDR